MRALKKLVASKAIKQPFIIFRTGREANPDQQKGPTTSPSLMVDNDARTGMPFGMPKGAICVQRFDDSLNSAIRITYRISLRSSSMPEPRDPLLKVLNDFFFKMPLRRHS